MNQIINTILRLKPRVFFAIHTLILAIMLYGISTLEIRNNDDSDLPSSDPIVITNDKFEEFFGSKDKVLISIESDNAFSPNTLEIIREISKSFVGLSWVVGSEIKSLYTTKNITADDNGLAVEPLYRDEVITETLAQSIREKVRGNPLIQERIVSKDETASLVLINVVKGANQATVYRDTYRIIERFNYEVRIRVVGDQILSEAIDQGIESDATILIPLAILLQLLTLFLLFKNTKYVLACISTIGLSIIWTMGLMGLLGYPITVVTTSIPIMVAVIVSSYVIHYIRAFELSKGTDLKQSILKGHYLIAKAILAASLTSAVGAFTLILFKVTAIAEFGIITAIGTIVSAILAVSFLPFVLKVLLKKHYHTDYLKSYNLPSGSFKTIEMGLKHLMAFCHKKPKLVLSVILTLFVSAIFVSVSSLRFGANFADYLPDGHQTKIDMAYFDNQLGGSRYFNVMLEASEENGVQDPDFLERVEQIQAFAESQPYIGKTLSFVDVIKRIDAIIDNKATGTIPLTMEQVAQYLLLYSISSSPDDFSDLVDYEYKRIKIYIPVTTSEQEVHLSLYHDLNKFIERNTLPNEQFEMGGNLLLWIAQMDYIIEGKILNIIVSIILMIILCSFFFRSFKQSIVAIAPVVFSVVCTFSLMAIFGIRLEVSTAVITAVTIGIGIDFSYHFLKSVNNNNKTKQNIHAILSPATIAICVSIIFDILSNVVGFFAFTFSAFTPITNFGYLIGFSMILSGFATFTIIPACLALKKISSNNDIQCEDIEYAKN